METTQKLKTDICTREWQTEFKRHATGLYLMLCTLVSKALETPYELTSAECRRLESHYHIFLLYLAAWHHAYRMAHFPDNRPMTFADSFRIAACFHGTDTDDGLLAYGITPFSSAAAICTDRSLRKEWRSRHLSLTHDVALLDAALKVMETAVGFASICTDRYALMCYLHGDFFDHTVVLQQLESNPLQYDRLIRHLHDHCAAMHRALPVGRIDGLYLRLTSNTDLKQSVRRQWWADNESWPDFVLLCQQTGCLMPLSDSQPESTLMYCIPKNQEKVFCSLLMSHYNSLSVNLKDFPHMAQRGKGFIGNADFLRLVSATVTCGSPNGIIPDSVFSRAKKNYTHTYARTLHQHGLPTGSHASVSAPSATVLTDAAPSPASDIESAAGPRPLYLSLPSVPVSPVDTCLQPPLCAVAA